MSALRRPTPARLPGVVLVAALGAVLWPCTAGAVTGGIQARLTLLGGWTDNVFNAPNVASGPGIRGRESDLTFQIGPSLIAAVGGARAVFRAEYDFVSTLYTGHTELDSFGNALRLDAFFVPSGTTFLSFDLVASQSRLNALNTGVTEINVTATGLVDIFRLSFLEKFTWDITALWRFTQNVGLNTSVPLETTGAYSQNETVDFNLGLERAWRRDIAILELGLTFAHYASVNGPTTNPDGTPVANGNLIPAQQQFIVPGLLRWRHDFTHFLTCELAAGAVAVVNADGGAHLIEPSGVAGLYYFHERGSAALTYVHSASANTLIGATYFADTVALNGGLTLSRKLGFTASATAGYQFVRQLDVVNGSVDAHGQLVRADLTLSWMPVLATRRIDLALFLRYQLVAQWGEDPVANPQALPTYLSNAVLLGITGTIPAESPVVIPNGPGKRADRGDAPYISPTGRTP
jgi:hypothetical protein